MNYKPQTKVILYSGVPFDKQYQHVLDWPSRAVQLSSCCNMDYVEYKPDAEHVYYWAERYNKNGKFFNKYHGFYIENLSYQRVNSSVPGGKASGTLRIEGQFNDFKYNYLAFNNWSTDSNGEQGASNTYPKYTNGKWYFAFIDKVNYISPYNIEIEYTIDYWQTFLPNNDYNLQKSYVERSHVKSDEYYEHLEQEPVEINEMLPYHIESPTFRKRFVWLFPFGSNNTQNSFYMYNGKEYSVTYNNFMQLNSGSFSGLRVQQIVSSKAGRSGDEAWYKSINNFIGDNFSQAFQPFTDQYGTQVSPKGTWNIKDLNTAYTDVVPHLYDNTYYPAYMNEKCPTSYAYTCKYIEYKPTKIGWTNDSTTYVPKNKKIFNSQWHKIQITYGNSSKEYKPELFKLDKTEYNSKHNNFQIGLVQNSMQNSNTTIIPINYKSKMDAWQYKFGKKYDLPDTWNLTYYKQSSQTETASRPNISDYNFLDHLGDNDPLIIHEQINCPLNADTWKTQQAQRGIEATAKGITQALQFAAVGASMFAAPATAGTTLAPQLARAGIGAGVGLVGTGVDATAANISASMNERSAVRNLTGTGDTANLIANATPLRIIDYFADKDSIEKADRYMSTYGYAINKLQNIETTTRKYWNYIKTANVNITGLLTTEQAAIIKSIYNNGVTIWHSMKHFLSYGDYDNPIGTPERD